MHASRRLEESVPFRWEGDLWAASNLPEDTFGIRTTSMNSDVVGESRESTDQFPDDDSTKRLVELADQAGVRSSPWYAVWRIKETFGQEWKVAGPLLPTPGISQFDGSTDIPERRLYHWLHPPRLGVIQRRVVVGRDLLPSAK